MNSIRAGRGGWVRMKGTFRPLAIAAGAAGLSLLAYSAVTRHRWPWRATRAEGARPLPGDDLVPTPIGSLTHAITIRRPPEAVWPWLVQMGAGRAGWYSYDFVDNGGQRSAERIIPDLQHLELGSIMPASAGATDTFTVVRIEPKRVLVIGWQPDAAQPPVMSWSFVLEEQEPGSTRLLVRARASAVYEPPFGLPRWSIATLIPIGHAIMQRRQLLGIRSRAEGHFGHDTAFDGSIRESEGAAFREPWGAQEVQERLIERFIPRPDHGGRHETIVHAPAELVFDVAWNLDLSAHPVVRAIFRLREILLSATPPDEEQPTGLVPQTLSLGWGILGHRPGRELVMGAVTKPWEANVVFRALSADEFPDYSEPDLVKIVWTLEAEPLGPELTRFRTETRARATDAAGRRKFHRYWRFASVGIVLIRILTLPALRREAERRHGRQSEPRTDGGA
jgi:hypothetical protein